MKYALILFALMMTGVPALFSAEIPLKDGMTLRAPGRKASELPFRDGKITMRWNPEDTPYVETVLKKPYTLKRFTDLKVRAELSGVPATSVGRVNLRLRDARGEVFQYSGPVRPRPDGGIVLEWNITPATRAESWGGDKILDQPVSVLAFGIDYDRKKPPFELSFRSLSAETENRAGKSLSVDLKSGVRKYVPGIKGNTFYPWKDINGGVPFSIDTTRSNYVEIVLGKEWKLPPFRTVSVRAKFKAPPGCPVRSIGLRLRDKGGEVFQYSKNISFQKGGIIELEWDITAGDWKNSWGGNRNHKLDQPVGIYGFGVDYAKNGEKNVELSLLSMMAEVSSAADPKTLVSEPLYPFNGTNRFQKHWGTAQFQEGNGALMISGIRGAVAFSERKGSLIFFLERPSGLTLDAELIGGPADFFWGIRDASNTLIRTSPVRLSPGRQTLEFSLEKKLAGAKMPIRIESMNLAATGAPANVILRGSSILTQKPAAAALAFDVTTGNEIRVLKKDERSAFGYKLKNNAKEEGSYLLDLQLKHYDGSSLQERFSISLKPGEEKTVMAKILPDRFGHWEISGTVTETFSGTRSPVKCAFAYLDPAGPTAGRAPGFLFGICTHSGRWAEQDRRKEYLAAALCGAKVMRSSIEWGGIQPAKDCWNFRLMDEMVESYGAYGIELQAMFAFTAKWAAPLEKQKAKNWLSWSRCRPDLSAWSTYVKTMAERYRGRIRYWEVWNEPDLSGFNGMSLAEYVELQKTTYQAVKTSVPEAVVMSGGFATMSDHPGRKEKHFHRNYLVRAKGSFETHAYHEHGSFQQYADLVDGRFLPMRRETGTTVPWYANETAVASMHGSERNQAETLFKKLLFSWSRGAIGYSWYDLRNDGFDPFDAEHNYGMMTNDFQPKPVYSVFNMLAGCYRKMRFVRPLQPGKNLWMFEFTDGRDILLPHWDESGTASATLAIRTDAKAASRIDLMGNETACPIEKNLLLLPLGAEPGTLKLTDASKAELLGAPLQVKQVGVYVPGRPFSFVLSLFNPTDRPLEFRIQTSDLPAGFSDSSLVQSQTVAPGRRIDLPVSLRTSSEDRKDVSRSVLVLNGHIPGLSWKGNVPVPIRSAIPIPKGNKFGRTPDFRLKEASHVVSLTQADPALAHRIWKGTADHSAEIWLGESEDRLFMRVVVEDDIHHQPGSGFDVWKGDNIQFCFKSDTQEGSWEIGLTRLNSGKSESFVWNTPRGFRAEEVAAGIRLRTERKGTRTVYEMDAPLSLFGLTRNILRRGIRFNLLINENDGEGRDGWLQIAPGIGENKNPGRYPFIVFD